MACVSARKSNGGLVTTSSPKSISLDTVLGLRCFVVSNRVGIIVFLSRELSTYSLRPTPLISASVEAAPATLGPSVLASLSEVQG